MVFTTFYISTNLNTVGRKRKSKKNNRLILYYFFGFIIILVFSILIYPSVSKNLTLQCANSLSCKESLSFKIENNKQAIFNNQIVQAPQIDISKEETNKVVLGVEKESFDPAQDKKHIYVNLAAQTLSAYEGDELFMETPISSGLWGKTPTGEFRIWIKLRSTTMSGGSGADYYYLPNVPYVMYFSNSKVPASRGFGLHGTYWHNNFGHPMSHGCVNMKTSDIAKLYEWANPVTSGRTTHSSKTNPGTKITIYEGT